MEPKYFIIITTLALIAGLGLFSEFKRAEQIVECEKELPRNEHCVLIAVEEKQSK